MKKNILVADDSALMRRVICDIINADNRFQAIETCSDGLQALEKLRIKHYDAVFLDIYMPRMTGLQLLEHLQAEHIEATVIVVSSLTSEGSQETLRAMELGAVDFITKPKNIIEAKGGAFRNQIVSMLQAVFKLEEQPQPTAKTSFEQVRTRREVSSQQLPKASQLPRKRTPSPKQVNSRLIALACSTGGPKALHVVIPMLDACMNAPMVLVQHMPVGFTKSLAERLDDISQVTVKEAEDDEMLQKGVVYIAPGGKHLEVVSCAGGHKIHLNDAPPIGGLKPCANVMFESLKDTKFDEITCVVLTGMGADGTAGIEALDRSKPIHVIAQNEETCVVYGMPRAIAEAGYVDEVVPLESIAKTIIKKVGVK